MKLTNSQIASNGMFTTYTCLSSWISFVNSVLPNTLNYDPTSCAQIALISRSAMKTIDYIAQNANSANVVRVSKILAELHDYAWRLWTTFTAQSRRSVGKMSLKLTPVALQGLATFDGWDIVLNSSPTFSPPVLLDAVLKGVIM